MSAVHSEASPAQMMLQLLEKSDSLLGACVGCTHTSEMQHGPVLVSELLV